MDTATKQLFQTLVLEKHAPLPLNALKSTFQRLMDW